MSGDALILCVRCMRWACATPGKCGAPTTLSAPIGDASEALWLSFGAVFEDRPAPSEEGAPAPAAPPPRPL